MHLRTDRSGKFRILLTDRGLGRTSQFTLARTTNRQRRDPRANAVINHAVDAGYCHMRKRHTVASCERLTRVMCAVPPWGDDDPWHRSTVICRLAIELEYWIRRAGQKVERKKRGPPTPHALTPFTISLLIEFGHARVTRVIRVARYSTVSEGTCGWGSTSSTGSSSLAGPSRGRRYRH